MTAFMPVSVDADIDVRAGISKFKVFTYWQTFYNSKTSIYGYN